MSMSALVMPRKTASIHINDLRPKLTRWTELAQTKKIKDSIDQKKKFETKFA